MSWARAGYRRTTKLVAIRSARLCTGVFTFSLPSPRSPGATGYGRRDPPR